MIETLVGALVGGTFRLAPEVLKWFDRKGERSHELAMQEKAIAMAKHFEGFHQVRDGDADTAHPFICPAAGGGGRTAADQRLKRCVQKHWVLAQ